MRRPAIFGAVFFVIAVSCLAASAKAERVLVAFGTSLTQNSTWPEKVVQAARPVIPEGLRLHRVAEAGKNSQWAIENIARVISKRPDIVIIEFAINDADILDGVRLRRSRDNHLIIIEELRVALPDTKIILMVTNPVYGPRGWLRPFLEEYYELYSDIAREAEVYLVDVLPKWKEAISSRGKSVLLPDGLHPTDAAAAEIVVPLLTSAVTRILSEG